MLYVMDSLFTQNSVLLFCASVGLVSQSEQERHTERTRQSERDREESWIDTKRGMFYVNLETEDFLSIFQKRARKTEKGKGDRVRERDPIRRWIILFFALSHRTLFTMILFVVLRNQYPIYFILFSTERKKSQRRRRRKESKRRWTLNRSKAA